MSVIGSNILAGSSAQGPLTVERSYWFNNTSFSDNHFRRSNTSSYAAWTFSFWVKGLPTVNTGVFSSAFTFNTDYGRIYFDANRRLRYTETYASVTTVDCFIPSVNVDPSAWTHYVIATSRQASGAVADRIKIYVNGVQQTLDGASVFPQFASSNIGRGNTTYAIGLLQYASSTAVGNIGGVWMTEAQLVTSFDTLFNANSFGVFNSANQWAPKQFSGTYGAGSFYLKFNNATSAATLGNDSSGLGNNFTAGPAVSTARSVFDTPSPAPTSTNGNYPVWDTQAQPTGVSSENLLFITTISGAYASTTPMQVTTFPIIGAGKFYAEFSCNTANSPAVAVYTPNHNRNPLYGDNNIRFQGNGQIYVNNVLSFSGAFTWGAGNVIGIMVDSSTTPNSIAFVINGVVRWSFNTTSYPTVVAPYHMAVLDTNAAASSVFTANFGQSAFSYTPPTGYTALNSQTIPQGEMTYSGTFTGNASADGPLVYLNGAPRSLKINGNVVTFGTHANRLANGFKIITNNTGYNNAGPNLFEVVAGSPQFKYGRGQINP